jgi:hypothetical protein
MSVLLIVQSKLLASQSPTKIIANREPGSQKALENLGRDLVKILTLIRRLDESKRTLFRGHLGNLTATIKTMPMILQVLDIQKSSDGPLALLTDTIHETSEMPFGKSDYKE